MRRTFARRRRLLAATLATGLLIGAVAATSAPAAVRAGPNLALGKAMTASSSLSPYVANNANDGNQATYWESSNNAFPQWIQVDLGSVVSTDQTVLKLPVANWGTRTQTLSIQGSTNGSTFTDLSPSAGRTFNPAGNNTVTIDYTAAPVRYVRVRITANTGWPAGQLSELEVYGQGAPDPQPGSNLAVGKPITASGHVHTYVATNANDDNVDRKSTRLNSSHGYQSRMPSSA